MAVADLRLPMISLWTVPLRQVLRWHGYDCGRVQTVWPVGAAILMAARPDVVCEVGPDHLCGLDTRDTSKVLPRRPTDQHHAISTSATVTPCGVFLSPALQSCAVAAAFTLLPSPL